MKPPGRLVLYERANCHLCEEAGLVLDELIGPDAYERIDIDSDDDLVIRYGFRIPVVSLDGIDVLEAPITRPDLAALLGKAY